jgi:uncharacterized OB-fold protein
VTRPAGALLEELAQLAPDALTEPFWAAARQHRLVCQLCSSCGTWRLPPTPVCHVCRSFDAEWETLAGTGRIYSFTVVRSSPVLALAGNVPYVIAVVELDDAPGVRLVTNVVGCHVDAVTIDAPVGVVWDDVSDAVTIPRFALIDP